jgi:hypothetical protein
MLWLGGYPTSRAMPVYSDLPKYLKINTEPEQLDLFGWRPQHESTSSGGALSSSVCSQIASVACVYYGLSTEQNAHLRNLITHECSGDPHQPAWHDYIIGLASTMSFLPTLLHATFFHSDRAALASDWAHVQSDLDQVWHAITTAERYCNEQRERRRASQAAE